MSHQIIDNFLPEKKLKLIKNVIMGSEFNWFYQPAVAYDYQKDSGILFYFTHLFYEKNIPISPFYNFINENLISHLKCKSLIRVKANLYPNQNEKQMVFTLIMIFHIKVLSFTLIQIMVKQY